MRAKILYFSLQANDSTSWWRSGNVLPYIKHPDFELIDISDIKSFNWSNFSGVSTFVLQRPFASAHVSLIKVAKDMGAKIILDYDDLLTHVPQENPTHRQYRDNKETLFECINLADEIWASTQTIADTFNHPNTHIVPNAWNDYTFGIDGKRKFNKGTKKVMYRGGGSHEGDVYDKADLLVKTIQGNTDFDFSFFGSRYTALEIRCGDNYHILEGMPLMDYFKYYFAENNNIAIFPLVDNLFNRGKSNIAMLEAIYAGSSFFGNKKLPEFNLPFISDINDLPEMLREYDLHEKNNELGWEWVRDERLLSNVNKLRINRVLENI